MPILGPALDVLPPEIDAAWEGVQITWTGYDGIVWDLTSPATGVVLAPNGVRGLNMPPITRYTRTSPALAGSRYTGFRVEEREVFWPVFIYSKSSSVDFVVRDRAFWQSMRPDRPGVWAVGRNGAETRYLRCRYADDGDQQFDTDPVLAGWCLYGISLVADDQPMWEGEQLSWTFLQDGAGGSWFSDTGSVFTLGPASTLSGASVSNPGDVDAWPVWRVDGPTDSGSQLGVGGGEVVLNASIAAGAYVTIDTRPDRMSATTNAGVDLSDAVTWGPLPVPPGTVVDADIALTSPGAGAQVSVDLTPLYYRAW